MIVYSKEFFKKKFSAETMKAAYMSACKWYATNVLSKDKLHNVQVEFEKSNKDEFPTIIVHLFAVLSETELRERHCKICKEYHGLFYMNNNHSCDRCEVNAYQKRADEMILIKTEYYKELLGKRIKEGDDE